MTWPWLIGSSIVLMAAKVAIWRYLISRPDYTDQGDEG